MISAKDLYHDEQERNSYLPDTMQVNKVYAPAVTPKEFHKRVRDSIIESGSGHIEYAEFLKFFSKVGEEMFGNSYKSGDTDIQKMILEDVSRYGREGYKSPRGVLFEPAETAVSYDYSNNPQWVEINEELKEVQARKKALEEKLKAIPAGKLLVDEETGETFTGPSKSSKSSFKITIGK